MALKRAIKRWDLVALTINGIIGAGIFGLPSMVYGLTQTYSLFVVLGCGILVGFLIFTFAEVSSRFSSTGGPYLYAHAAFGKIVGYEVGWLMWLTRISAFAAVCNLLVTYVAFFWPEAASYPWRGVLITLVVIFLTIINLAGVRQSATTSNVLVIGKLIPLILFIVVGLFFLNTSRFTLEQPPSSSSISSAIMIMIFAFSGFEISTIAAGEIRSPRRNLPTAMIISLFTVITIYILIQVICIGTLDNLAESGSPLADAAVVFMGKPGAVIISLGAIVSMMGALNVTLLSCTRLPYAMAEQKQIPSLFSRIHPRFSTPHVSILISSVAILVVSLGFSFMGAVTINVIIKLITYVIVCLGLPVLRFKTNVQEARFKIRGGVLIAFVSLVVCVWLLLNSSWKEAYYVVMASSAGMIFYLSYQLSKKIRNPK